MSEQTSLWRELVKAYAKGKFLIIVENNNDRRFYINMIDKFFKDTTSFYVRSISIFKNGTGGCGAIIKAIEEIQENLEKFPIFKNIFRGIIDRDSFYYIAPKELIEKRNNLSGLFVLRYYSYESHLFTEKNITKLLCYITNLTNEEIDDNTSHFLLKTIEDKILHLLYYVGLECLRNAREKNYVAKFCYSDSETNIYPYSKLQNEVLNKLDKKYLDELAINLGIHYDKETVKKIVKGKHILYVLVKEFLFQIQNIQNQCNEAETICRCLSNCDHIVCKWKSTARYETEHLCDMLKSYIDEVEVDYIAKELKKLNYNSNES